MQIASIYFIMGSNPEQEDIVFLTFLALNKIEYDTPILSSTAGPRIP
jgi:hypothetical protein